MPLVNRNLSWTFFAVITAASLAWWSGLQANDGNETTSQSKEITELLVRIKKLEHRVEVLEQGTQPIALRSHVEPSLSEDGPRAPAPSQAEPPQVGIIYRLKKFTPDKPESAPKAALRTGDVIITR